MSELDLNEVDNKLIFIIGELQESTKNLRLIIKKCQDLIDKNTSKEVDLLFIQDDIHKKMRESKNDKRGET